MEREGAERRNTKGKGTERSDVILSGPWGQLQHQEVASRSGALPSFLPPDQVRSSPVPNLEPVPPILPVEGLQEGRCRRGQLPEPAPPIESLQATGKAAGGGSPQSLSSSHQTT